MMDLQSAHSSTSPLASPRITIVIPTLNRLELLKRAFESALSQTAPASIIVSDNGSTDGTADYIASIQARFPDVRFLRRSATISAPAHGWTLISIVDTEWMVFLSDDDYLEPGFVQGVLNLIDREPTVSFVYTGCRLHFADVAADAKVGPPRETAAAFLIGFMDGARNICMCATAFRVQDLRAIGPQPEDVLIGDMFYWSRILRPSGFVACDPKPLSNYVMYRPEGDSETSRTNVRHWARESRDLAQRMSSTILADPSLSFSPEVVRKASARYLSLTISNQFVWNALRGGDRIDLARAVPGMARFILQGLKAPVRVLAALLAPRAILRWGVLGYARLLASRKPG